MTKVGIYDPYFNILGGAERYVLSIAKCLEKTADITIFVSDRNLIDIAEGKFGIKISQVNVHTWPNDRGLRNNAIRKLDIFFYVTDGSLFFGKAKKNILIIQTPEHIPTKSFINALKLRSWQKIICYSNYIAEIIYQRLGRRAEILFVPIEKVSEVKTKKANIILSVGRFFPHLHSKKQKELVEAFKELVSEGLKDTVLYLVGSIDPGAEDFFETISQVSKGYPVKLVTQARFDELKNLYQKAKVYWHASGWGEDLKKHPERAEHFGVSTIEAMSHGAVPVVFNGGGQKEIVSHTQNGFTWNTKEELKHHTLSLLQNETLRNKLAKAARNSSEKYTKDKFCQRLHEILKD